MTQHGDDAWPDQGQVAGLIGGHQLAPDKDRLGLLAAAVDEYAIFGLDADGTVTSWNPGAERIKGYRAEEIIGRHFSVFYPPEAADVPKRALARAAQFGCHVDEGWRVRKDGSRFWARVVLTALHSSDGSLRGFTKLTRDDTESRERWQRSSRRFNDLFGLSPVGIGLFDEAGCLVDANDALGELLGYRREDLPGRQATDLLHPQDHAEGLPVDTLDCASDGQNVPHRLLVRADGRPVYCELRAMRSVQDDGSVLRLVVFQEVTERLRQAEVLRHQTAHDYVSRLGQGRGVHELLGYLRDSTGGDSSGLPSPVLIAAAAGKIQLQQQLREALHNNGLQLYYQPVVTAEGTVISAEALVRWHHPEHGLLTPNVLLQVAEEGDLLGEVDRWVLRTALREAASWPSPYGRPVSIAVNLSALTPDDPRFVDDISRTITDAGIGWQRVVLELVETVLARVPIRTRLAMDALVHRGVRFAVDDFGTGYSSLARLKDLPAQIVKTDRRFVAGLGRDPSDLAVAKAIAEMARAMRRQCVAEGVETASQFQILSGLGVDAYQGWLFSHAVPGGDFRALLDRGRLRIPTVG